MADDLQRPPLLIALVGANPLPNYLTICALRPSKIALLHSRETEDAYKRLARCLAKELDPAPEILPACVDDPASAAEVGQRVSQLVQDYSRQCQVWLNYTGGTKVMAAHALWTFRNQGGRPEHASYLHDGGPGSWPKLRFDDGTHRTLAECRLPPLRLETLVELHGARLQRPSLRDNTPKPTDAHGIAAKVLADPELPGRFCKDLRRAFDDEVEPRKLLGQPFDPEDFGIALSIGKLPTEEQIKGLNKDARRSWFRHWRHFLAGGWLEDWVAQQIQQTGLLVDPERELASGFQVFRGERNVQLEIDVAVVRNYRSYFISCTTAHDKALCKQKLFEIAVRSRQLAGDLARPALVCLADGDTLSKLRDEVDDEASPGQTLRVPGIAAVHVFGLEDLRSWAGWQGASPNLTTLRNWLES